MTGENRINISTLKAKLKDIKLFVLDFDGILTDGFVYVDDSGKETVRCSRRDSLGIKMLMESGVEVVVISAESNPVVARRCEKMKVRCWQDAKGKGKGGKLEILKEILEEKGLAQNEVAYMGDDLNDLEAIKHAGLRFTVPDACYAIRCAVDYITLKSGGNHAVREVCDLFLNHYFVRL
ncbi:MAG: hypothetical protein COU46_01725 [Candidatus Niyogibacteria bacterium CG10_big_fil_rev_8_21_14_0_10_42_19]|uniref:3-deoxy-D-manno-octulosonate 8-phosphate phosphatase n=1 Tax=Candidatus Niyogibacteria bacterium CG10_big_fil_rev_8_21_14_0_10_42_19 TaxID=1974725 RepID=A0A2H0TFQ4_9BACT|nr:MAG: hypothetical protein COU46_01725 [Candidatus Niyogibacteria bacterium CG10_big_fil_rev_8_21_14_0_10_42_19]